jgi:hypothetical protein
MNRRWAVRRVIGVCGALAALLLATGTAWATVEYQTVFKEFTIEGESGGGEVKGKIDSTKGKCVKNRKVKVFRKQSGNKSKLGSDKTNDKGKFGIGLPSLKNGKYFAEVKEKDLADTSSGEARVCLSRNSGKVTISAGP